MIDKSGRTGACPKFFLTSNRFSGIIYAMKITKTSVHSGITRTLDLDVTLEEYASWRAGELIQNAMPRLNADEREFIKTGITAEEWEEMFGTQEG